MKNVKQYQNSTNYKNYNLRKKKFQKKIKKNKIKI